MNLNVEAYHARAWELTKAQGPALFQLGLSMYMMVANQLTVWSIMFFSMLAPTPFRNLFSVEQGERGSAGR